MPLVNPINGVVLYNQLGRIDPSRPFQPFGTQPERGSYLVVGSPEFLTQTPESVLLRIDWQHLPAALDFARYYESYGAPIDNSSFKVAASFLHGARWHPLHLPETSLFREVSGNISAISEFAFEAPQGLTALRQEEVNRPLEYDENATGGFFRLELIEPAFGFGAGLYANVLSDAVLKNAASRMENPSGEQIPLPNIPFTPIATGISIFLGPGKHLPVTDAGAILAWPFLNTLFERAGILDADHRLDHMRAVALLLYLTWGETYREHRASPILKILAGLPPEAELPLPLQLTDEETALCDGLLSAIIAQWDVVKNTSLAGIRGTFFGRDGLLVTEEGQYVLTVESKPFDLLLDKLPWSISLVKTSWMDRAVMVRWR